MWWSLPPTRSVTDPGIIDPVMPNSVVAVGCARSRLSLGACVVGDIGGRTVLERTVGAVVVVVLDEPVAEPL
jgi:hypothetical protein